MYEGSVLRGTGQMWKLHVATGLVVPGTLLLLYGSVAYLLNSSGLFVAAIGVCSASLGAVWACVTIRCPACGAHWY